MEGLNPNSPPPKNTEVKLTKWEYSDPVGVPYPDVIDVLVTLKNPTNEALSNLEVEVGVQWQVGPSRKQSAAAWSERSVQSEQHGIELQAGGEKTVRVTIDLKKKMDELEKQRKWPFALRASAESLEFPAYYPKRSPTCRLSQAIEAYSQSPPCQRGI